MNFIFSIIAIIFGVTIHEFAHAWTANRLGDPTARLMGRITLNPLAHFDLFGTMALILVGIGWGKPVPVNPHNFIHPKRDSALVSLAGPFSNFISAIILAIPLKYLNDTVFDATPGYKLLGALFWMNIVLLSLNILPFPPLDGSKIIGIFIPQRFHYQYDRYLRSGVRYFIIFILIDILLVQNVFGVSALSFVVLNIAHWIAAIVSLGT